MHSIGDVLIYVDKFGKNYFEEWYQMNLARKLLNDWREGNGRTENASPLFS